MGIPSMQLEIPHSVRTKLNNTPILRMKFSKALVNIYNDCITHHFVKSKIKDNIKINKSIELNNINQLDDKEWTLW